MRGTCASPRSCLDAVWGCEGGGVVFGGPVGMEVRQLGLRLPGLGGWIFLGKASIIEAHLYPARDASGLVSFSS